MFDIDLGQLGLILASAIYFSTEKYEAAPAILLWTRIPPQLLWERSGTWYSTWNLARIVPEEHQESWLLWMTRNNWISRVLAGKKIPGRFCVEYVGECKVLTAAAK